MRHSRTALQCQCLNAPHHFARKIARTANPCAKNGRHVTKRMLSLGPQASRLPGYGSDAAVSGQARRLRSQGRAGSVLSQHCFIWQNASMTKVVSGLIMSVLMTNGYWPVEKSQPIVDKTQTIRLAPDTSQLSEGERKAVAKL